MRNNIKNTLVLTLLLAISLSTLHARDVSLMTDETPSLVTWEPSPDPFSTDEGLTTEEGPAPGDVPLDGGLSLLLAAGATFGVSRLMSGIKKCA